MDANSSLSSSSVRPALPNERLEAWGHCISIVYSSIWARGRDWSGCRRLGGPKNERASRVEGTEFAKQGLDARFHQSIESEVELDSHFEHLERVLIVLESSWRGALVDIALLIC